jgi:uncharacterized protein YpmB
MKAKRIIAIITVILVVVAIILVNRKSRKQVHQERMNEYQHKTGK